MTDLNIIIDNIVQYGLTVSENEEANLRLLEKNLVNLYAFILNTPEQPDTQIYQDYSEERPLLRDVIGKNFPSLGFYKVSLKPLDLNNHADMATADAIDDLHDIILGLMEVKWRFDHTTYADAILQLQLLFRVHLKEHIVGLLMFLSQ